MIHPKVLLYKPIYTKLYQEHNAIYQIVDILITSSIQILRTATNTLGVPQWRRHTICLKGVAEKDYTGCVTYLCASDSRIRQG